MKWWPYYEKWFQNERYRAKTAPLLAPATPFLPPSCCQLRIMIDLLQMARRKHPLIFQCFIKKYLFTVVSLGHGRDLSRQFPNGARSKRGWFSLAYYKINGLQYYFRNKSISSVTKWILISYNETWVWLELFQQVCCTRHCQRVAIQLVISQLGQDKPHTLMVRTHISSILLTIIQLNYLIHFLNASYNFPTRPIDQ